MFDRIAGWVGRDDALPIAARLRIAAGVGLLAVFVLALAGIVALDSLFVAGTTSDLQPGDIAPVDILAPASITYISDVLTEQRRTAAIAAVSPVYDPPDPGVARQQVQLLRDILDYADGVRRDPYGTPAQKRDDLVAITALTLDDDIVTALLRMNDDMWQATDGEAVLVLERVLRESIREIDLPVIIDTLPTQVSVRFDPASAAVVIALIEDVMRPNRQQNPAATELARAAAAEAVAPESRTFERGQIVIRAGARIDAGDYEALSRLGLLQADDMRGWRMLRALLAASLVTTAVFLYVSGVARALFQQAERLIMLAVIALIVLLGARIFSPDGQLNLLYPASAAALIAVVLTRVDIAVVWSLGLGLLAGLMFNNSLEAAALITGGGMMGALAMQRSERVNRFFFAGAVISLTNTVIVLVFAIDAVEGRDLNVALAYALINGVITAMTALAAVYALTVLFNLPTNLKLAELNQPSQPLLQRLLREAPGTYQHSLQVANLTEQAVNAIGGNADLARVAALYHDIGKMLNAAFFVENQVEGQNPHDALNDPYRSADIIISHVTDGERLARQYRLPSRLRDFILEHHGTTRVSFFYNRALVQSGDPDSVDPEPFTYPGPTPRSRETAIMMLADSCESTVRARKPANKQEISDIVEQLFELRIREGQLDDSTLTLNDLDTTRTIFIDMLQAVFHPRINYPSAILPARPPVQGRTALNGDDAVRQTPRGLPVVRPDLRSVDEPAISPVSTVEGINRIRATTVAPAIPVDDDDAPLPDVPVLRRPAARPTPAPSTGENAAASDAIPQEEP